MAERRSPRLLSSTRPFSSPIRNRNRRKRLYPSLEELGRGDFNDDADQDYDNVSYESDHSAGDDSRRSSTIPSASSRTKRNGKLSQDVWPCVKCLFIAIALFSFCLLCGFLQLSRHPTEEISLLKRDCFVICKYSLKMGLKFAKSTVRDVRTQAGFDLTEKNGGVAQTPQIDLQKFFEVEMEKSPVKRGYAMGTFQYTEIFFPIHAPRGQPLQKMYVEWGAPYRYKQEIVSVLRENFTTEYLYGNHTKAVLRLVGEKWIDQEPVEPYVVLIAGTRADAFADALVTVFSNITKRGDVGRIFCNEHKERQILESEVKNSLSKPSKTVILQGIDKLRGNAPLCLHSLCDSDNSPFPSALILLTVGISFGPHPSCEDEISSYLLSVWDSNHMNEDQIRPILSRITSFVICLQNRNFDRSRVEQWS